MFEDLLIFTTVLVFVPTFLYIAKRDDLSSLSYLTLFVYTIFTQIGYVHYPQLSAAQGMYYGQSSFYVYWLFMLLSLIACFAGFWARQRIAPPAPVTLAGTGPFPAEVVFFLIVAALLSYVGINFGAHALDLHYSLDSSEVSTGLQLFLFASLLLSLVVVVLYSNACLGRRRLLSIFFLIPSLFLYVTVSLVTGSRSNILYLAIAIATFHLHPFAFTLRKRLKAVIASAALAGLLLYSLTVLEYVRSRFNPISLEAYTTYFIQPDAVFASDGEWAETVLGKDYYWPSHLLFVALTHDVIDPVTVLRSNLSNSLAGLHVEYLTQILNREAVGHSDRIVGIAFHLFIEGFVAAGWLGWLYNGVVWNLGLHFWKSATRTSHPQINRILVSLAASLLPNIMRSQSSAFLRMFWGMYLPVAILAMLSHKVRPTLTRRAGGLLPASSAK